MSSSQGVSYAVPKSAFKFEIIVCVPGTYTPLLAKNSETGAMRSIFAPALILFRESHESPMDAVTIAGEVAVGLVVGTLVGLTGLGGGMLLLPVLISVLGVPPILAVGSDAVINCITKIGAGGLHWRQGNVNWRLVLSLAYGSIPGAILGVMILARVRAAYGNGVNDFLRVVIGALLIVIPMAYLLKQGSSTLQLPMSALRKCRYSFGVTAIGFIAGLLVGVTSIGSGR